MFVLTLVTHLRHGSLTVLVVHFDEVNLLTCFEFLVTADELDDSKLIRALRLYGGAALKRSLSICITVDISRFGRP